MTNSQSVVGLFFHVDGLCDRPCDSIHAVCPVESFFDEPVAVWWVKTVYFEG